jgi:hypothetical protein
MAGWLKEKFWVITELHGIKSARTFSAEREAGEVLGVETLEEQGSRTTR